MRKTLLFFVLVTVSSVACSQDFTNKGKDFWVGYGSHCDMYNGNGTLNATGGGQEMVLYFATEALTTVTVSIPGLGYTQTYSNIAANTIFETPPIPKSGTYDARLGTEGTFNKGIHITSDHAIVAYAHIYNGSRSGASLLFPTNTLGKEYYSLNMSQNSQQAYSYCYFFVVATDTGTTTVQITPSANTQTMTAGQTYTLNLTQGQVFNAMGTINGNSGVDLTGSKIISVLNGGKCKPIAVFSGSGKINLNCPVNGGGSADNYIVQSFPQTAWGKNYLTVPTYGMPYNYFRIAVSDPSAVVKLNGVTLTGLVNNFYYQFGATNLPSSIQSDKPIMVAQYITTSGACGNNVGIPAGDGDPEVIYLSSIEQNISNVLLYATPHYAITEHFISVLIPNGGTGVSSFRLDGAVPATPFVVHPQNSNYSYLQQQVNVGTHTLQSDSGFNASAYGYGSVESYGYNAGTYIKDLYQQIGVQTLYGIETTPSVCTNSPFKFKVSLPYIPDSMYWNFHNAPGMLPNNNNVMVNNTGNIMEDSFTVVNGKIIHWYSLPTFYTFTATGVYPITITTYVPNADCGSVQDIDFDLQVSDPPAANFTWTGSHCVAETFQFTETTPQFPKPTYHFWWDFGDPASGASNNSGVRNPTHLFSAPGTYSVRFSDITTPGCLSDTIVHQVVVQPLPGGTISGTTSVCINAPQPVVTFTGTGGTAPYTFTYTINGGAPQTVNSANTTATVNVPTNVAGTFTYVLVSVKDTGSLLCTQNISGQQAVVTVMPNHSITLTSPASTTNQTVCINTPIIPIVYTLGGGATGATVTGLPAGVTFVVAGTTLTISGTPTTTVGSPFTYTITTTGNACLTASATGTITVSPDHTITLTSAPATTNQTVCINTPITPIAYALGGGATGATVTGLPAGVTSSVAGTTLTISGSPTTTAGSPFTYNITTTGNNCVVATASGTITVLPVHTITLTSAPATANQTVCINTPITPIVYTLGGGATGATVSGLPAGVTFVVAGTTLTISGTPTTTAGSPFSYSITTTGNACLTASATGTITVSPDHTITLTSAPSTNNQTVCMNAPITPIVYALGGGATGATVSGLPAGVTGTVSGSTYTISGAPSTLAGSPFTYHITTTGNNCVVATATGTIAVKPLPTANFNFSAPSCETRVITFTDASVANLGTLNGWSWDFGDPGSGAANSSSLQNPVHVFASAGSYTVTLVVTSTSGCVSIGFPRTMVINARPRAGYIIPEVCLNDTYAQFLDTSHVAAGSIVAWNWNFGDPGSGVNNTSALQNPQHSYSAVGPYPVTLIVTSNFGCRDTILQTLVVNGSFPVADFTVNNPATLCANDSVAIVNTSTVFPGVITKVEIYWDNVGFPAVFQLDDNPYPGKVYKHLYPNFQSPPTVGYTIKFRAYSGGVCLNEKLGNITLHAAPKVQFNAMPDTCLLAAPFQITEASEIGGVPGSSTYSGPGISPSGIFSPAIAGVGTHTILYTFSSTAAGCTDTMSRTITVLDTAHAVFTWVTLICDGVPGSFTDQSTAPATVTLGNTVWNFGDGSPVQNHAPGSTFPHLFPGPGTYTVTMYNVSAYGCNSTICSRTVTVDPNHTIVLTSGAGTNNQTVCINVPVIPIVYTLGGGATGATISGLPPGVTALVAGNTFTISGAPTTTVGSPFNYSITTTGNSCTTASAIGTIAVSPDHTITLTSGAATTDQRVCLYTPVAAITYTLGGGATGAIVSGLPPGVSSSVVGNTLTISGTPSSTAGTPYNYSIVTTGNNCVTASETGVIKVSPYPRPSFVFNQPGYCIPNATVTFNNTSSIEDGTENQFTYSWDFGDPASGSNTSSALSPSHFYNRTGPFRITLSVTSGYGCTQDTVIWLTTVHPQPIAKFEISKPGICIGDMVTFTDQTDGIDATISQWFWDFGDGQTANSNPVPHLYRSVDTFTITLYAVNGNGCHSDTITRSLVVYPYPTVDAGPDLFVLENGSVVLEPVATGNDLRFLWTPNLYLNDNTLEKPTVTNPLTDMTYKLTVTARGGCQLSDVMFLKLLKSPRIPNTFTPNNDGINDKWVIEYLDTYPNNRVQVFTRTGQLVFESHGYSTPWDGTYKGKPLPFDTYYYIIEPNNGRKPITGYVTIIK